MSDRVGKQLGNYRLLRRLGEGGFGQVYLGEHVHLRTYAALKLLLKEGEGAQGEAFRVAFLREAQRIATLKHRHILRVLDFGMEMSTPYLVMEYAAHGTLRDRHPRGSRVSVNQVISYTKQIAQALHHAHEARLIHRDVKPANVLLDERDTLLLSDFGIATVAHHTSSIRTTTYAGTAAYMAPEQLQGKPVPASDQYALAIMIYEWLCGQLPYQGDPIAVGMQHLMAPIPSLRMYNGALSPEIEAVVHQAMNKDPRQRFRNIQDFALALEQAALSSSNSPTPQARGQLTPPKKNTHVSQKTIGQLLGEGKVLLAQEQYEEGIRAFDQAIQIYPSDIDAHFHKGEALLSLKRYEEGIRACDQAIEVDPSDCRAYIWKGAALIEGLKRYEEGIRVCDQEGVS